MNNSHCRNLVMSYPCSVKKKTMLTMLYFICSQLKVSCHCSTEKSGFCIVCICADSVAATIFTNLAIAVISVSKLESE